MTWIKTIAPDEADGELRALYDAIGVARGGIAEVHRAQSLNPKAIRAHLELYKAVVFQRSSLGRKERERIAVVVSRANVCAYCVAHHAEALRNLGDDPAIVSALADGELPATLSDADQALLAWARKGALAPTSCSAEDAAALRALGHDDRAILDAALTVAYFAFVNRLVLLLGVDLESDYARTCSDMP
jgi:uncharacterized peroxidase-related enzyme